MLSGCNSEEERQRIREHEARIAAEQARQQRILNQHIADLNAETARRQNVLAAETKRDFNRQMSLMGRLSSVLAGLGGIIEWVVYSVRRLGEKHTEERTKRHEQNLKAIVSDPHISPEQRGELYGRAIEAANKGGTPLISYHPNQGGAA